jgi:hypothetical protein
VRSLEQKVKSELQVSGRIGMPFIELGLWTGSIGLQLLCVLVDSSRRVESKTNKNANAGSE